MKDNSQFKTMRHIETVRNFLQACIVELLIRAHDHDQSKLQEPELAFFNEYTPKLRDLVYGSEEYKQCLKGMLPAINHHNAVNRHHPEHYKQMVCIICFKTWVKGQEPDVCDVCHNGTYTEEIAGIKGMNLIDLLEMLCDWKAASLRHETGDIYKSLEINAKRFGYSEELKMILTNTVDWMEQQAVPHRAQES